MAKDKSGAKLSKEEKKALKAEKKANSQSPTEVGVTKVKPEKKDKKEKKKREALAEKAINEIQNGPTVASDAADSENDEMEVEGVSVKEEKGKGKTATKPIGALVPFANPLADEKVGKKVFKGVKKAAAQRTLKRGVKEVVKALRKSPTSNPSSSTSDSSLPVGLVVLAADISPMDVISHIPVLCEDHNIPYIYVTSRAELGMAGMTKRPTSVVMVSRDVGKKAAEKAKDGKKSGGAEETDGEEWSETYKGLVKVVEREGRHVKI